MTQMGRPIRRYGDHAKVDTTRTRARTAERESAVPGIGAIELTWRLGPQVARGGEVASFVCTLDLIGREARGSSSRGPSVVVPVAGDAIRFDRPRGLVHVDVPGAVRCTIDVSSGEAVYARLGDAIDPGRLTRGPGAATPVGVRAGRSSGG